MSFIAILAACTVITLLMHAGMKCGYGAWAEREAEKRAEQKIRDYLQSIEIRVNQRVSVEFIDETKHTY